MYRFRGLIVVYSRRTVFIQKNSIIDCKSNKFWITKETAKPRKIIEMVNHFYKQKPRK